MTSTVYEEVGTEEAKVGVWLGQSADYVKGLGSKVKSTFDAQPASPPVVSGLEVLVDDLEKFLPQLQIATTGTGINFPVLSEGYVQLLHLVDDIKKLVPLVNTVLVDQHAINQKEADKKAVDEKAAAAKATDQKTAAQKPAVPVSAAADRPSPEKVLADRAAYQKAAEERAAAAKTAAEKPSSQPFKT